MDAYFDSAIIVKLYVQEATSPDAIRLVGGYAALHASTVPTRRGLMVATDVRRWIGTLMARSLRLLRSAATDR